MKSKEVSRPWAGWHESFWDSFILHSPEVGVEPDPEEVADLADSLSDFLADFRLYENLNWDAVDYSLDLSEDDLKKVKAATRNIFLSDLHPLLLCKIATWILKESNTQEITLTQEQCRHLVEVISQRIELPHGKGK